MSSTDVVSVKGDDAIDRAGHTSPATLMGPMTARKPPFDPNSPGAQNLLRAARAAADQVDVVITKGFFLDHDDNCRPIPRGVGERLTIQRGLAEALIAEGAAERAVR